jgi:hypothetical protein
MQFLAIHLGGDRFAFLNVFHHGRFLAVNGLDQALGLASPIDLIGEHSVTDEVFIYGIPRDAVFVVYPHPSIPSAVSLFSEHHHRFLVLNRQNGTNCVKEGSDDSSGFEIVVLMTVSPSWCDHYRRQC